MRLILALIPVLAIHPASHRAHPLSHACSIVAFGDSITWGAYASRNAVALHIEDVEPVTDHVVAKDDTTYPGDLARDLHTSVCNYGVPGELTFRGLLRLRKLLDHVQPKLVVIMEGVNDLPAPRSQDDILNDLRQMVDEAKDHHVSVLLCTLMPTYYPKADPHHPLNGMVHSFNVRVRTLAKTEHVSLADVEAAFLRDHRGARLTKHDFGYDYLHPNDAGYRVMADAVEDAIRRHHLPAGKVRFAAMRTDPDQPIQDENPFTAIVNSSLMLKTRGWSVW